LKRFQAEAAYSGSEGSSDLVSKYGVIIDEGIGQGCDGRVVVSGECSAYIYVQDENHDYCDVDADTDTQHLVSAERGNAHILWKESGTGYVWARLRLSNPPPPASETTDPDYRYFCVYDEVTKLNCDDPATAYLKEWNDEACDGYGQWECGSTTFSIYETLNIYSKPTSEAESTPFFGVARKWPDSEHWEILVMENLARWVLFYLDEDMGNTNPNEATATVQDFWDGHDPDDIDWGEGGFKVHDTVGLWPRGKQGGKGLACWNDDDQKYVVVTCQQYPQLIYVTAGPFEYNDDPVGCSGPTKMNRAGDLSPGAVTSVGNPFGCSKDSSGECPATYDSDSGGYVLIGPYESSGVGDLDVTGSATRSGCSGSASDVETTDVTDIIFDSTWLTVTVAGKVVTIALPTVTQSVVTDVSYSAGVLTQTKKTLTILCAGSGSDSTVFTGTEC
jgi:hypothetical protein